MASPQQQMQHLEAAGGTMPTLPNVATFDWTPADPNLKDTVPEWDDRRAAGEEFFRRYGRTLPDNGVITKILATDKTFIDITGESGIFANACSKFPPIDVLAADFEVQRYKTKFYPVTTLDYTQPLGPQLDAITAPRSVFMGEPFGQKGTIPLDRWCEALDWIPAGKVLYYFGPERNWTEGSAEQVTEPGAARPDHMLPNYLLRMNFGGGYWEAITPEGPARFNNKLANEFTLTYSQPAVEGWHPKLPSIFEVWQKN